MYKSAADPGGSALARAPPLDRGRILARLVITITDKGEKGASSQIITIKDTDTAAYVVVPTGDYYDNGRSGKP